MDRGFWIGFVVAAIIIPPVLLGSYGMAADGAMDAVSAGLGALAALVLALVVGLAFRKKILEFFKLKSAEFEEGFGDLSDAAEQVIAGDQGAAKEKVKEAAKKVAGWYSFTNFYRWIIGTCIALLLAYAGFAGTALLFEQNSRIKEQTTVLQNQSTLFEEQTKLFGKQTLLLEEQTNQLREQNKRFDIQNDLSSLSLVSQLRQRLLASTLLNEFRANLSTIDQQPIAEYETILSIFLGKNTLSLFNPGKLGLNSPNECTANATLVNSVFRSPNPSSVRAIADLAGSQNIGEGVIRSLEILLEDENPSVVIGALHALDLAESVPENLTINLSNLVEAKISLQSKVELKIRNSLVGNLSCENCEISVVNSMVVFSRKAKATVKSASHSILVAPSEWALVKAQEAPQDNKIGLGRLFYTKLAGSFMLDNEFTRVRVVGTEPDETYDVVEGDKFFSMNLDLNTEVVNAVDAVAAKEQIQAGKPVDFLGQIVSSTVRFGDNSPEEIDYKVDLDRVKFCKNFGQIVGALPYLELAEPQASE
ncbi:hypothetical protein [Ruegeria hyattellae]|uniref:hypothetical protein n=1 Tax=Ruegeria hyattellae TaxID=3233337 RepID=UPI00355C4B84